MIAEFWNRAVLGYCMSRLVDDGAKRDWLVEVDEKLRWIPANYAT